MYQILLIIISTILAYVYMQNLPDYWRGYVTTNYNGTMYRSIPSRIQAIILTWRELADETVEDTQIEKIKDALLNPLVRRISFDEALPTNEPPYNVSGTIHKVTYRRGIFTDMEVLDEFNYDGNKSVPVKFATSWYGIDFTKSYNHSNYLLMKALQLGNVLNTTFSVDFEIASDDDSKEINKGRKWEIDELFCYYEHSQATLIQGKCMIDYTKIIEHYIRLWNYGKLEPEYFNGIVKRVSNNDTFIKNYPCGVSNGPEFYQTCENATLEEMHYIPIEQKFLPEDKVNYVLDIQPVGIGWAVNMTFGINRTSGTFDLNFTMIFNKWTQDLPESLLRSYRDSSFFYDKFTFEIYYWIEDPTTKEEHYVPSAFWIIVIILAIPGSIVVLGVGIVMLTRTKRGFIEEVWDFQETQYVNKKIEINEQRKQRLREQMAKEMRLKSDIKVLNDIQNNNVHDIDQLFLEH